MPHESLIQNLGTFYKALAALCYIETTDIIKPPTNVNVQAGQAAGLSADAVSLLQRLPSLSPDLYDRSILPDGTHPVFYADDNKLGWARRPTLQDDPEIPGTQFVLTNANIYGTAVIYDTETCQVMSWRPFGEHADRELSDETPFSTDEAQPPERVIGQWTKNLITLDWLPLENELIIDPATDELGDADTDPDVLAQYQLQFIQRTLKDVFLSAGWNAEASDIDNAKADFDPEAFLSDKEDWMQRTQDLLDRAYEESWTWAAIREAIGGELASSEKARILDRMTADGWQPRHLEL